MVNIQPVQVFTNYGAKYATKFNLDIVNDNLESFCIFQYQLCDEYGVSLYSGNLTMSEPDYDLWNTQTDINEAAYIWATNELGLTIIP